MTDDLDGFRRRIDACDREIVLKINERLRVCQEIGRFKKRRRIDLRIPEREQEVIEQALAGNEGPCPPEILERVFRLLIEAAVELENSSEAGSEDG